MPLSGRIQSKFNSNRSAGCFAVLHSPWLRSRACSTPANIHNSSDCSTYIACGSKNLFLHRERNSMLFNSLICYYTLLRKFYFNIMQLLWLHFYNWCSTPEENFLKSKKCYLGAESENFLKTLWVAILELRSFPAKVLQVLKNSNYKINDIN